MSGPTRLRVFVYLAAGLLSLSLIGGAGAAPRALGGPDETVDTAVAEAEEAARASKMRVSVSAVGFDIPTNSAAEKELQASASAGGGLYVPATDIAQLRGALQAALSGNALPAGPPDVALLPVAVVRGDVQNGARVEQALLAQLVAAGWTPAPPSRAGMELAAAGLDPRFPLPLPRLAEVGKSLKVEHVVYARVLSVGRPVNATADSERAATILVNVVEVKTGRVRLTRQVSPEFTPADLSVPAVLPAEQAREAAEKLLAGFKRPAP